MLCPTVEFGLRASGMVIRPDAKFHIGTVSVDGYVFHHRGVGLSGMKGQLMQT